MKVLELDENAAWDYIREGYLLRPRTILKGRPRACVSLPPANPVNNNIQPVLIQQMLEDAMGDLSGSRRAVMFSGGFDSILMGLLARQRGAEVTALTVQFEDFNLSTVLGAVEVAQQIGIVHHILHVKPVEFLSAFEIISGMTDEPLFDLDLAVVYAALKKYDPGIAGDVIISGMGSDQWFGNEALVPGPGGILARLEHQILHVDAHQKIANTHGCHFVFPFLSGPLLSLSLALPDQMKKDKKILRALAVTNMIPHRGVNSQMQVSPVMRRILIKTFGDRAWPNPVSIHDMGTAKNDQLLRRIIVGLWLEQIKDRL